MALKRKHSSSAFRQSTTTRPISSTKAAENCLSVSAAEENERTRKRRRTKSFEKLLSLHFGDWSGSSDQTTAPRNERRAEDHICLQSIDWSLENHGLQEPLFSSLKVLPPEDQQAQTPPAPEGKRLEGDLEVAVKIGSKPKNMKCIYVPGHPADLPLEVGLLLLVNKEPRAPEIIQLLDWQDQPERYILVMERPAPCKDLWDYVMLQGGFLSEDIAQFIIAQVTKGAHTCCQRGVFHRDIKPENLLINPETLEVKLIDFGCGDLLQDCGYERFCGTPEYCPPEYYVDHRYHGKPTTVWSLGVLLFMLVCGHYPEPRDIESIDYGIWFEPDLSNECSHLIRSLLNKSPSQRIDLEEILLHDWFKITKPAWRRL